MGLITEYDNICLFCGKPKECTHHLIGGNSTRRLCDEDEIIIPCCNNCHNLAIKNSDRIHGNPMAEKMSKMIGQLAWEKQKIIEGENPENVRDKFIKRYGRSFL